MPVARGRDRAENRGGERERKRTGESRAAVSLSPLHPCSSAPLLPFCSLWPSSPEGRRGIAVAVGAEALALQPARPFLTAIGNDQKQNGRRQRQQRDHEPARR